MEQAGATGRHRHLAIRLHLWYLRARVKHNRPNGSIAGGLASSTHAHYFVLSTASLRGVIEPVD